MIISISGRKHTGKTTLAKELIKRDFCQLSFADRLKELVAGLYGWKLSDLYDPIEKEKPLNEPVEWNATKALELANIINATSELNAEHTLFFKKRDAMQYIGTEVLRRYDPEFHVKATANKIEPNKNYVIDDIRFVEELNLLHKFPSYCLHIIRPYYFNYSNHQSEICLNRTKFQHVMLNDGSQQKLVDCFELFMDLANTNSVGVNPHFEQSQFLNINQDSAYWAGVLTSSQHNNTSINFSTKNSFLIFNFKEFLKSDIQQNGYTYSTVIDNPYIVDDLKTWNIPSNKIKIPSVIENDEKLINAWLSGVVDSNENKIFETLQGFCNVEEFLKNKYTGIYDIF